MKETGFKKSIFGRIVKLLSCLSLLGIHGCSPVTLEDLRYQSEAEMKKLVIELRGIQSKEDVQRASKRLKKRFNQMAKLLIAARKFPNVESDSSSVGEELFVEFARIYEIPGARDVIESIQVEAVHALGRATK